MYQQHVPQPRDEKDWGNNAEYEEGYGGPLQHSDQLADAIARRLQAQAPSTLQAPVSFQTIRPISAGMRLALAIVSLGVLVPLSAITLGILGPFSGVIALGIVCAAIVGVNVAFSTHR